jgi:type I restriction enzyme S subunit
MIETHETGESESSSSYPPSIQAGIPTLGTTPKGWTRFRLRDLIQGVERRAKLVDTESYQLVTAKRNRGGIVARAVLRGDQIRTKTQFYVAGGDFLISNRQVSHGAVGIVPVELDGALVSNEYTAFHTTENIDLDFLNALSHSTYFQQTCFHSSIGVHVEKLVFRLEDWLAWEFDIPPLDQQRRIVTVLAAWDRAIDGTQSLVAAKKYRKSGLVQKVFDDLPKKSLLEAADVRFSGVDKKSVEGEQAVRLCNYTDVFEHPEITANLKFMAATATKRQIAANRLRKHDVVFTKDSETASDIAECALVAEDIDNLVCGYHLGIARPREAVCWGPYLAHALRHSDVRHQFSRLANGVVRYGLTLDSLDQIEVPLPDLPVQRQIATTLTTEDHGTTALFLRVTELRNQKRGLMRKLLTGEWCLDERFDADAHAYFRWASVGAT